MKRVVSQNMSPQNADELIDANFEYLGPKGKDFSDIDVRRFEGSVHEAMGMLKQISMTLQNQKSIEPTIIYEQLIQTDEISYALSRISYIFGGYLPK